MAADDLLARSPAPTDAEVLDGLGGVLCRCTGYTAIVEAVRGAAAGTLRRARRSPAVGQAVGARIARTDGVEKVTGAERFGDDLDHAGVLLLRAVRSPHDHARFTVGDLAPLHERHPGLVRVLTAADVPGDNRYGIYATGKDQPVLADGYVRFRGEAVLALVGDAATIVAIRDDEVPIAWEPLPPLLGIDAALDAGAVRLHEASPGNVLVEGVVRLADVDAALAGLRRDRDRHVRDDLRRARLHRARGRAPRASSTGASRSSPPPRRRTWTATSSP